MGNYREELSPLGVAFEEVLNPTKFGQQLRIASDHRLRTFLKNARSIEITIGQ